MKKGQFALNFWSLKQHPLKLLVAHCNVISNLGLGERLLQFFDPRPDANAKLYQLFYPQVPKTSTNRLFFPGPILVNSRIFRKNTNF